MVKSWRFAVLLLAPAPLGCAYSQAVSEPLIVVRAVDPDAVDATTRDAFRTAFGQGDEALISRDGRDFDFVPVTTAELGAGRIALVSTGVLRDAGHPQDGLNAVHYLATRDGRLHVVGAWFGLGASGSHGAAASSWAVSRSLSRWPVLYTEGGGTWQGCTLSFAVLTELRPEGPVDVADFPVHFSNEGMVVNGAAEIVGGTLVRAAPDSWFEIHYDGTARFSETYFRTGDRYRLREGESRMPGC